MKHFAFELFVSQTKHLHMKARMTLMALLIPFLISAQQFAQPDLTKFTQLNQTGMLVLGSWALANIATGFIASNYTSGSNKYFHQMNGFWNLVNLGIAGFGYYSNNFNSLNLHQAIEKSLDIQKALLFNSGLDLAYISGGFLLREIAKQKPTLNDRLTGYGNSVILQGAFLLAFDLVLSLMNTHQFYLQFSQFLKQLNNSVLL